MVAPALLASIIPQLLAAFGGGAAGAGSAVAGPAVAEALGPTVASTTLPSSVNLANPLLATAQPFANAPAEAFNLLQGASGGATDIAGRAAETQTALESLFGAPQPGGGIEQIQSAFGDKVASTAASSGTPAPAIPGPSTTAGTSRLDPGADRSSESDSALADQLKLFAKRGATEDAVPVPSPSQTFTAPAAQEPVPPSFQPTPTPSIPGSIDQTLTQAAESFIPGAIAPTQAPSPVTNAQVQQEMLRRLLGSDGSRIQF